MSKKTVSLFIVVLIVLSAIPVALPVAFVSAETTPEIQTQSFTPMAPRQVVTKEVAQAALNAIMKGQSNMVLIIKVEDGKLEEAKAELTKLDAQILDENNILNMLLVRIKPEKVKELNYISVLEKAWLNKERKLVPPDLRELPSKAIAPPEKVEPKLYNSTWVINALQFIQDIGYNGNGTVVAILDTGVDPNHPFLNITPDGKRKIIDWKDFTDEGYVDTQYQFDKVTNGVLIINKTFVVFTGLKVNSSTGLMEYVTETLHIDNVTIDNITSANGVYHFGLLPERYFDLNFDKDTDDFYPVLLVNSSGNGYDVAYVDTDLDYDFTDEVPLRQYNGTYDVAVFSYSEYGPLNYVLAEIDPNGKYAIFGWDGGKHGTHVAGIAAGYDSNNNAWDWLSQYSGTYVAYYDCKYLNVCKEQTFNLDTTQGVAPGAQIMAIRVLRSAGWGYDWEIINGMTYAATHGADVISMSLGGNDPLLDGTDPESIAVNELTEKYGVVFVIAAGNDGPGINIIARPGVASKAITVAAAVVPIEVETRITVLSGLIYGSLDLWFQDGFYYRDTNFDNIRIAYFSSRGPRVDGDFKPDIAAPGHFVYSSIPMWAPSFEWLFNKYGLPVGPPGADFMLGTSMATPHVSGVVALLISGAKAEGIDYSPEKIKKALESGATWLEGDPYLGQEYTELDQGHGLVNVTKSWEFLKAMDGMKLPVVDHWANVSYSDFANYLNVDVIKGLYARNSVPEKVKWHIKYVGDTEYRTFNIYATEPWIKPFVTGTVILQNNTEFVLTVRYDTEGLEPGLYVGRIIIDDPTTPVIDDEILNTIIIPEEFAADQNYTIKWEDVNGAHMQTHHFVKVPEGTNGLWTKVEYGNYLEYGIYSPYGMYIFPFQTSDEPYVTKNPVPGVWELVTTGFNWEYSTGYYGNLTASIYGLNLTPSIWNVKRIYSDNNTNFTIKFNITNLYAPFNGTIVAIGLGTYNASIESVADGEYFIKGIEVPSGVRQLKIRIGNPSVTDADLDLYLYDSEGNLVVSPKLYMGPTANEEIVVDYPSPGKYSIVVEGFNVKDKNGNPTTTTFDLVIQMILDKGNIKLDTDSLVLGVGESKSVIANITVNKNLPAGVYSGLIELVDFNIYNDIYEYWYNYLQDLGYPEDIASQIAGSIAYLEAALATIPITLVVDKAPFAVGLESNKVVLGKPTELKLTVKHAITLEPVANATVVVNGRKYTTDKNGVVIFNFTATSFDDTLNITVSKENFVTFEGSFDLEVFEPEKEPVSRPQVTLATQEEGANVTVIRKEIKENKVEITINGTTNKTATIMITLPKDAKNIEVSVEPEGHLVGDPWTEDGKYAKYLFVTVKFASPVKITIRYTLPEGISISTLNFLYYRYYIRENKTFNELYQTALELGIDNETLQKALRLNQTAQEEYEKALELSGGNILLGLGDPRLLGPLRKAYLNIKKAVEILERAIEEAGNS